MNLIFIHISFILMVLIFKDSPGGTSNPVDSTSKVLFTEFSLDNGLRVILSEDHSIPSVAINICYHVGSKDEDPGRTGFAHLFEHLMFEGSLNVPPGEYDRITQKAGGDNNAYTTDDKTNYYLILPSNQLELGLWLESDRMLQFAIPEISLRTQKDVVKEEKRQRYDNQPYGTVSIELAPRLFKNSGYRWDGIGSMKHIENATMDDIRSFFERFYTPNNAVMTIVGDINIEQTRDLIKKYFGGIKRGPEVKRPAYNEPPLEKETSDEIYDNIQFPGIFITYRIPKEYSDEFIVFDLLSDILSSGESSRLYKELVYEKRLVSDIGCYVEGKEFVSLFHVYAILMPGKKVEQVQKEIDRIIDEVKNGRISSFEITKVKNKVESRFVYRKQTMLSKAELLTHFKVFYNEPELINTYIDKYQNITSDNIVSFTKKYIKKDNRVVLIYLPKKKSGE